MAGARGPSCPWQQPPDASSAPRSAGPLLELAGEESGGFHLEGPSSTGKTVILHATRSVWGVEMGSWRTTDNAVEAIAANACDTLLMLDEIGQGTPQAVDLITYMLGNQRGKRRMSRGITGRPRSPGAPCSCHRARSQLAPSSPRSAAASKPASPCAWSSTRPMAKSWACSKSFMTADADSFATQLRADAAAYCGQLTGGHSSSV